MTPLLRLEGLNVAASDDRLVVDGLDLTLSAGGFSALVGESGSGKSMAARAILGLLPPGLRHAGGRVLFEGRDLGLMTGDVLRKIRGPGIGMVFQEPMTALNPAMSVGDQIAEGLALHEKLRGRALHAAVIDMMRRVGIPEPEIRAHHWPHQFSGGMRQRIMLASAMAMRPRLLIADEPTTALDTLTQAEVMALMVALTREHDAAVLLISHDLGLVGRHADQVHVLERGRVVEAGPTGNVLSDPQHGYTKRLVAALPKPKKQRATGRTDVIAELRNVTMHYARQGWLGFRRGPRVLDGVDLEIRSGEVVALVGGSGAGKSSIGRALLRLSDVSSGQVLFGGRDITVSSGRDLADLRARSQLVHQDPYDSLDPRMRAVEIVAEPLRLARLDRSRRARRIEQVFDRVGLAGMESRFPHQLSGGQRQRVALARALVRQPSFVVADEPVSALDMTVQRQVMALLAQLQREDGFASLFISHDFGAVMEIADRIVVLDKGRIVEQGPAMRVFSDPQSEKTRRLIAAMPKPIRT